MGVESQIIWVCNLLKVIQHHMSAEFDYLTLQLVRRDEHHRSAIGAKCSHCILETTNVVLMIAGVLSLSSDQQETLCWLVLH